MGANRTNSFARGYAEPCGAQPSASEGPARNGGGGGRLNSLRTHARILARIRLTRTAAERGPVLSGACGPDGGVPQNVVLMPLVAQ